MKFLTKRTHKIEELARLALDAELYESPMWVMISAYRNVLANSDVAKSSEIIIIQDDEERLIGAVYFNDKFADYFHWGINTMMYVRPAFRGKGHATSLIKQLNKRLNVRHFDGTLTVGYGVEGSNVFWHKMGQLNKTDETCRNVQFIP